MIAIMINRTLENSSVLLDYMKSCMPYWLLEIKEKIELLISITFNFIGFMLKNLGTQLNNLFNFMQI